jgi:homoserine kinase
MNNSISVRVPATSANLGPGFDCLGLTLDLWNDTTVSLAGSGIRTEVTGEGAGVIPDGDQNLIVQAMQLFDKEIGRALPAGILISCHNRIPLGSGMGSSASAVLAGLMAANVLAGNPLLPAELLKLGVEMEGHPDNIAAALFGGLTISGRKANGATLSQRIEPAACLRAAVAVPQLDLPTRAARAVLPKEIPFCDAVFNLGRTAMVVEAMRNGNLDILDEAMQDRLHQPYRLGLIPGAESALRAARQAGAKAAALSGAGPGIIAFCEKGEEDIAAAMVAAFTRAGVPARSFPLGLSARGAYIVV